MPDNLRDYSIQVNQPGRDPTTVLVQAKTVGLAITQAAQQLGLRPCDPQVSYRCIDIGPTKEVQ